MSWWLSYKTTELLNIAAQWTSSWDKNYFPTLLAWIFIGVAVIYMRDAIPWISDSLRANSNNKDTTNT